ncbi:LIM-domain binding protein, partial [Lentinula edodes]
LGHGQGLIRLLQFSGNLASESKQKHQLSWWNELIKEYFTPKAIMRFTLWRDNQRNEAKPFEIGVPILPRFLLVTTQSGVKSMTLTLDGARERLYAYGHAIVECVAAVWTYKYNNGYTVALRGPLTVHVVVTAAPSTTTSPGAGAGGVGAGNILLKFEDFQFDASYHDKYIALESIMGPRSIESPKGYLPPPSVTTVGTGTPTTANTSTSTTPRLPHPSASSGQSQWDEPRVLISQGFIPGEPVNAFGIPQATMRCLELAESVAQMSDLIVFSKEEGLGPLGKYLCFLLVC